MQITLLNTTQKQYNYIKPSFKASSWPPPPVVGKISFPVAKKFGSVAQAYKDIMSKLERKTPEGIKFLQEKFPNITIGENLIFHNCGEEKTSILFRMAEDPKNSGLTRIIERQSASTWGNRIVKNSFLLDRNERLIKIKDNENQVTYPQEREYYTEDDFEEQEFDKKLSRIFDDLDFAMLQFRLFLNKHLDKYAKLPSGKLPVNLLSSISVIDNLIEDTNSRLESLPKKVSLEARHQFDSYKMTTGSSKHVFKNLGEEQVSISYHSFDSHLGTNLKRLSVFDKEDNLKTTFVVTGEGKMLKNLNQNFETSLPPKPLFADEKEIQEAHLMPMFEKYLKLYNQEILKFNRYIKDYAKKRLENLSSVPQELPETNQVLIARVIENINQIQYLLKSIDSASAANIKKNVEGLYAPAGRKGVTFDGYCGEKRIYFLPVKSNIHSGLVRVTITESNGTESMFLIKDGKYIVKNFNSKYPQIIPPTLIYVNQAEETIDLTNILEFIDEKTCNYKSSVKEFLETKKQLTEQKNNEKKQLKEQQRKEKELLSEQKRREKFQQREKQQLQKEQLNKQKEEECKIKIDKKAEKLESIKRDKLEKQNKKLEKEAKQNLLKYCRAKISELGQNLNGSKDTFNDLLKELQSKINGYLET